MKQQIFNYAVLLLLIASTFYAGRAYERGIISDRIQSISDFGSDSDYKIWNYIINNNKKETEL